MFQSGDVDDINVFNGNVILRVPVGQPYPLRPGFGYNLTLTYNSKVWDSNWSHCRPISPPTASSRIRDPMPGWAGRYRWED